MSMLVLAFAAQGLPPATLPPPPQSTCDQPVYMVVAGETKDRERMVEYAQAIAASEVYERLGGYYINTPRRIATFEGDVEPAFVTLIVRFPCLANAQAFWNSRVYQEEILPIRQNPSAGDYSVTVYPEAPLRSDMVGKVGEAQYRTDFSDHGVEQTDAPAP